MKEQKITVVIPTYNERNNVEGLIQKIINLKLGIRIIVVDDDSPDRTWEAVAGIAGRFPEVSLIRRVGRRGLGTAYVEGFKKALSDGADLVLGMDADFSHDPGSIPDFLNAIRTSDVVVGSRYLNGINVVNWPISRLILSVFANKYVHVITGLPVKDATSGFICYRREALSSIALDDVESDGYSFLVEMKYRVFKKGFRLKEIPIVFVERRQGSSKMSLKVFMESVFMVWRLRLGLYKK